MAIELSDFGIWTIGFVVWLYSMITAPVYALFQQPWSVRRNMIRQRAIKIGATSDSVTYRKQDPPTSFQSDLKNKMIDTMVKLIDYSAENYGTQNALGTRRIIGEFDHVGKDGKILKKLEQGEYSWKSYTKANEEATCVGRGFISIGMKPKENLIIFADTRVEWFLSALGAFKQSLVVCTLYATLGEDAIVHGINETEAQAIVTSPSLLPKILLLLHKLPKVNYVIYFEDNHKSIQKPQHDRVIFRTYSEVLELGAKAKIRDTPPTSMDSAVIMYTSGSTGLPKGVILSHRNMIAAISSFSANLDSGKGDSYIGYLPLAHVLEMLGETVTLAFGVPLGYSSPLTLTDVSSMVKEGSKGDATIMKPTALPAVPLILDRIFKAAMDKAAARGKFFKKLFNYLIRYKISWMRRGWQTPILNRIIFRRFRALLGGKLRVIGCGGAPLAPDTQNFIRAILGCNVCQGYGLTETTAIATMMATDDFLSVSKVGPPNSDVDIKLVDWEEGGYTVDDRPNPRGEIVIGGDCVTEGYYKNPEKTLECFHEAEGKRWFSTGDIGEIFPDGNLAIIDRKKDLVKLQLGEYVSLGKVESVLKLSPYVENICIYGDSTKNAVVAIVSPDQQALLKLAKTLEKADDVENLIEDGSIVEAVLKDLKQTAIRGKLQKFEIPAACVLTLYPWTPDTKLITATFKLQRHNIREHYKREIENMYAKLS